MEVGLHRGLPENTAPSGYFIQLNINTEQIYNVMCETT